MTLNVSVSKVIHVSAVLSAAFFLATAPVAAQESAHTDDGLTLTRSGEIVGNGYVAPGFVDDGPPVRVEVEDVAEVPPPAEIRTRHVQVAQAEGPVSGAAAAGAFTPRQIAEMLAQAADADVNDPLEPLNRVIFDVNYFLERLILRPVAEIYVLFLPEEARDAIRNFLRNLRTPVVLANDLLQGEGERAWDTTRRFLLNSTVGVGGLIDVADRLGIPHHDEDLGQTFAVWGVPEPFFLVLPIFGPSNPRDAVGRFGDTFLDPVWHWTENTDREGIQWTRNVVIGIDSYAQVMDELKKLRETSIDYYAAVRSIWRQKREADIRNGQPRDAPLPDIRYDFNADLSAN